MKRLLGILLVTLVAWFSASASSNKITKEKFEFAGKQRTYYLYVPDNITATSSAPLILLLHGSNRNGLSLVEKWKELARKEGIILVGPDSADSSRWTLDNDGTEFLNELIALVKSTVPTVVLFAPAAPASRAANASPARVNASRVKVSANRAMPRVQAAIPARSRRPPPRLSCRRPPRRPRACPRSAVPSRAAPSARSNRSLPIIRICRPSCCGRFAPASSA